MGPRDDSLQNRQLHVSAVPACQYLHQPLGLMTPSIIVQWEGLPGTNMQHSAQR